MISPKPGMLDQPNIPTGVPVEATFRGIRTIDKDGDTIGWEFNYQLNDESYPEAAGQFVRGTTWATPPARAYAAHCKALGIDPKSDWDPDSVVGTPVIVIVRMIERKDQNGEPRVEFATSQVLARG